MTFGLQRGHLSSSQITQSGSGQVNLPSSGFVPKNTQTTVVFQDGRGMLNGAQGDIGIAFVGGYNSNTAFHYSAIDWIAISTLSNSGSYGDLITKMSSSSGMSSATRAITTGGENADGVRGFSQVFSLRSRGIVTGGNVWWYTNVEGNERRGFFGISSATRGVCGAGIDIEGTARTQFSFVTFATVQTFNDFGTLGTARGYCGSVMSTTRGIIAAGEITGGSTLSSSEYITIATTGNGTSFGDLGSSTTTSAGVSSSTRGVICGGQSIQSMRYYEIATTGTGTSFGNLAETTKGPAGTSNGTRGVISGGFMGSSGNSNSMQYITIASTGNSASFGTLSQARYLGHTGQIAQAHGGI
jgi:hypothetical protein